MPTVVEHTYPIFATDDDGTKYFIESHPDGTITYSHEMIETLEAIVRITKQAKAGK